MHTPARQGERIRERRKALGLSQEKLAHRVGVSRNTVANWETGTETRGSTLCRLAETLGVSIDWLVNGTDDTGTDDTDATGTDG